MKDVGRSALERLHGEKWAQSRLARAMVESATIARMRAEKAGG